MFRPWIHVAIPPGWPSASLRVGIFLLTLLMLVPVLLARVPGSWSAWSSSVTLVIRGLGVVLLLWSMGWVRVLLQTQLPRSVYTLGGALVYRERERKRKVRLPTVVDIDVEVRPAPDFQVAVIELADGRVRELCPMHWKGAAALYREVRRQIDRHARAHARRQRRRVRRSSSRSTADSPPAR